MTYPIVEIPGVDVELDNEVTEVNKDLDAESTGVEVDTGAYGSEDYDAVLEVDTGAHGSQACDTVTQDQGNKTGVYGLGQQVPTIA